MARLVNLEIDEQAYNEAQTLLNESPKKLQAAVQSAVNRTLSTVSTRIAKKVQEKYAVKSAAVRKSLRIYRYKLKNSIAIPTESAYRFKFVEDPNGGTRNGAIVSTGHSMPLKAFQISPKQPSKFGGRRKGYLTATVLKSKGARTIPGVFWARMKKNGHVGIFYRETENRFPIQEEMRLSIPQMIGNREILADIEKTANEKLNERFAHEVEYRFRGR